MNPILIDLTDAGLLELARSALDDLDKQLHEDAVGNLVVGKEMMVSRLTAALIAVRDAACHEQRNRGR